MNATAIAIVGNAKIVGFSTDTWKNPVVEIQGDDGKTHTLDRRCVNSKNLKIGQRGYLDYRDYATANGCGFQLFFDLGDIEILKKN